MEKIVLNGKFLGKEELQLKPDNHSYRYGDGLFETIKVIDGNILFKEEHFERLVHGLSILKYKKPYSFSFEKLCGEIINLCRRNQCENSARVRLSLSRGNGGIRDCDDNMSYLIECWPLKGTNRITSEQGLKIGIYPDAYKSCDIFSNIKSANYLPYVMAANWASENELDDALILNQHKRICDATIANVFWVKANKVYTPPLSEGCIAGIMRKKLLASKIHGNDYDISEKELQADMLLNADEIFLTNVIKGIMWVSKYENRSYQNTISNKIISELF